MKKKSLLILCVIGMLVLNSDVQAGNKMPVDVIFSGDDIVGNRLVYQVKENIRKSNAMNLSLSNVKEPKYVLVIYSIDASIDKVGNLSAYSVVWLQCIIRSFMHSGVRKEFTRLEYSDSSVGLCGGQRVIDVADSIIAKTDNIISENLKHGTDPISMTNIENQYFQMMTDQKEQSKKIIQGYKKLLQDRMQKDK